MSREICVNLTYSEAVAWAAHAAAPAEGRQPLCLIRRARNIQRIEGEYIVTEYGTKWALGDVLIGRESWWSVSNEPDARVFYCVDGFGVDVTRIRWKPAVIMPKIFARHRRRVAQIQLTRFSELTVQQVEVSGAGDALFQHFPGNRLFVTTLEDMPA